MIFALLIKIKVADPGGVDPGLDPYAKKNLDPTLENNPKRIRPNFDIIRLSFFFDIKSI